MNHQPKGNATGDSLMDIESYLIVGKTRTSQPATSHNMIPSQAFKHDPHINPSDYVCVCLYLENFLKQALHVV